MVAGSSDLGIGDLLEYDQVHYDVNPQLKLPTSQ